MKVKKFNFFFFFPEKSAETKSSTNSEGAYLCCHLPWSYSAQITCRALGFHVYSLHHIFTTGAKYNGIDVLYYSLDQSSTDSTAHSGSQTQKQIWHMQCQQHDIISLWCIRKRLYSLCATACSLSLVFLLLCCNCGWACRTVQSMCLATTKKYRNGKKSSEAGGKVSASTLLHLFVKLHLLSSFDSV